MLQRFNNDDNNHNCCSLNNGCCHLWCSYAPCVEWIITHFSRCVWIKNWFIIVLPSKAKHYKHSYKTMTTIGRRKLHTAVMSICRCTQLDGVLTSCYGSKHHKIGHDGFHDLKEVKRINALSSYIYIQATLTFIYVSKFKNAMPNPS